MSRTFGPRRIAYAVLALLGFAPWWSALPATAQQPDTRPRPILNTDGPAGLTISVGFSPDSRRLYAAGSDKVVHVWSLQPDERNRPRATPVRTLRWQIARGYRGEITAMAVNPVGEELSVGGISAWDSSGDIAMWNSGQGVITRSLPVQRPDDVKAWPGHNATIASLDYAPNGQRLVSVDKAGQIRVWSAPAWGSTVLRAAQGPQDRWQPAIFLDNDVVAISQRLAPAANGTANWRIDLYDTRVAPPRLLGSLPTTHAGRITALAQDPRTGNWASADNGRRIYLWNGTNPNQQPQVMPTGRVPTSMSFGPGNILAVSNELDVNRDSVLELWDVPQRKRIDQIRSDRREVPQPVAGQPGINLQAPTERWYDNLTCAISLDGKWLASHSTSVDEVWLFRIAGEDGKLLPEPLNSRRLLRIKGRGQRVESVAFEDGPDAGYRLAFSTPTHRGKNALFGHSFDFTNWAVRPVAAAPDPANFRLSDADNGGWSLSTTDRLKIELKHPQLPAGVIQLDEVQQGPLSAWCWVADAAGKPFAVALGTDVQDGIFVYRLPQPQSPPRLLRYYREHVGRITGLSVSPDRKFLASGSHDETLKLWSLEGLQNPPKAFSNAIGWGAEFSLQKNQVVATNVLPAGIAAARGLKNGDVIKSALSYDAQGAAVTATQPAAILARMDQTPLYASVALTFERAGQLQPQILLVPAWEPLLTLFVDRRNEWAVWTPAGYFDASVAEGDELFGWQINGRPADTPRVLKAAELADEFKKPAVIRSLLAQGNLVEALEQNNVAVPEKLDRQVTIVAQNVPEVAILKPQMQDVTAKGQEIPFTARIDFPVNIPLDDFEVKAFVNGRYLTAVPQITAVPLAGGQFVRRDYVWSARPDFQLNQFKILVREKGKRSDTLFREQSVVISANGEIIQGPFKLHLLILASNAYTEPLTKLTFPLDDARDLQGLLRTASGEHYKLASEHVMTNAQITPESVKTSVAEISESLKDARPEDLLVVFFAGHGMAYGKDYYYVTTGVKDVTEDAVRADGIAWSNFDPLLEVPCRKLFLLDTCRSGNLVSPGRWPEHLSKAVNDTKRGGALIFSATSEDQDAREGVGFQAGPGFGGGHGAFTASLLYGLSGTADGSLDGDTDPHLVDRQVWISELTDFVAWDVYHSTGSKQIPTYASMDLMQLIDLPLVPVKLAKPAGAGAGGGK